MHEDLMKKAKKAKKAKKQKNRPDKKTGTFHKERAKAKRRGISLQAEDNQEKYLKHYNKERNGVS
jgi:hypothetical protein